MKDNFHMGYDLKKGGFNFSAANKASTNANTELLNGIAEDFAKASVLKAGVYVNKEEIINRLSHIIPTVSVAESIMVLSVSKEGVLNKRFINRNSSLFKELFNES